MPGLPGVLALAEPTAWALATSMIKTNSPYINLTYLQSSPGYLKGGTVVAVSAFPIANAHSLLVVSLLQPLQLLHCRNLHRLQQLEQDYAYSAGPFAAITIAAGALKS